MATINVLSGYNPAQNNGSIPVRPAQIAEVYTNVIRQFLKRADVQNGKAIAYKRWNATTATFEDTPKGVGDGLSTTGWCVSASSALLNDPIFQETLTFRKAKAKLVSIDIQERWYGHCYNGTQNKWHTAILLNESGINLIIDITCSQFSSDFINKWVWDFRTWEATFRSQFDRHVLTDCEDNTLSPASIKNYTFGLNRDNTVEEHTRYAKIFDSLHDCINITDSERRFLTEFFLYNFNIINEKILCETLTAGDCDYIEQVNKLIERMPFKNMKDGIAIFGFSNKQNLKNWLSRMLSESALPQNTIVTSCMKCACTMAGIREEQINAKAEPKCEWYLVINFENIFGVDSNFLELDSVYLPAFTGINIDLESIQNSGKRVMEQNPENNVFDKETNTIFCTVKSTM
jgi:hypothetical protein